MSIDSSEIRKIAWLARLSPAQTAIEESIPEMGQILGLVEQMNSVDTEGVEPLAHPMEISARFRSDEVSETDQRSLFQGIAPAVEDGHYLVPRVIE